MNPTNPMLLTAPQFKSDRRIWHELYRSAIYETDHRIAAERIAQAEREIIARTRALFQESNSAINDAITERIALDAALHALRVLKSYFPKKIAA